MDIVDVAFFVKLCEVGYEKALKALSVSEIEANEMISSLQSFVGGQLFKDKNNMSVKNLSEIGKIFLPSAEQMVNDLLLSFSNDPKELNDNVVKVKADVLGGKNIILPLINDLERISGTSDINIEMFTHEDHEKVKTSDMHVIFHKMEKADNLFFDRHWSLKINQGLYASKGYLQESGNTPSKPEDLLQHAILGLGDTFDRDIYSYTNWHFSGKYLNVRLNPALMINSRSVLLAAISAHLGIGPLVEYQNVLENKELCRVLPEIKGPPIVIDFAVRKDLSKRYLDHISSVEKKMLEKISKMGLEVIY